MIFSDLVTFVRINGNIASQTRLKRSRLHVIVELDLDGCCHSKNRRFYDEVLVRHAPTGFGVDIVVAWNRFLSAA